MRTDPLRLAARLALPLLAAAPLRAGDPPTRVARFDLLEGGVQLRAHDAAAAREATLNWPMVAGDAFSLANGARAELSVGTIVAHLGDGARVRLLSLTDHDARLALDGGTLLLHVRALAPDDSLAVDTPTGEVTIERAGDYRVQASPDGAATLVAVRRGIAELLGTGRETHMVHGGEVLAEGDAAPRAILPPDALEQWAANLDREIDSAPASRYVSSGVVGAEVLDRYGAWTTTVDYGPVWVPAAMPVGWAPYRYGHWAYVEPWGETWVDDAPWGFAPFHYGRWAMVGGAWGWVPGPVIARPVYAPALVGWVGGGGSGFSVSVGFGGGGGRAWVPLAPGEAWVAGYAASPGYWRRAGVTNITNVTNVTNVTNMATTTNVTDVRTTRYANLQHEGAVTAVSHEAFASGAPVQHAAIAAPAGAWRDAQPLDPHALREERTTRDVSRTTTVSTPDGAVARERTTHDVTNDRAVLPNGTRIDDRHVRATRTDVVQGADGARVEDRTVRTATVDRVDRPERESAPAAVAPMRADRMERMDRVTAMPRVERMAAPRMEAPRMEAPRMEAPRMEAPRMEASHMGGGGHWSGGGGGGHRH